MIEQVEHDAPNAAGQRSLETGKPARGAQRTVDFSDAGSATLYLSYVRDQFDKDTHFVVLGISTDGGANWVA